MHLSYIDEGEPQHLHCAALHVQIDVGVIRPPRGRFRASTDLARGESDRETKSERLVASKPLVLAAACESCLRHLQAHAHPLAVHGGGRWGPPRVRACRAEINRRVALDVLHP